MRKHENDDQQRSPQLCMYRVRIKICGICDQPSATTAWGEGADALGFVLAPSPRRLSLAQAAQLRASLPPFVSSVAVLKDANENELVSLIRDEGFSHVQADAQYCVDQNLDGLEHLTIPVVRVGTEVFDIVQEDPTRVGQFALFEGLRSGVGESVNWTLLQPISRVINVIVAGGLTPDNVGEAIRTVMPFGVDVSSGVESSPGKKDPIKIRDFIQAVRSAERELHS